MDEWLQLLQTVAAYMALWFFVGYLWQLKTRDASHVDAQWALGIGAAAIYFGWHAAESNPLALVFAGLQALWAVRLGGYIFYRHLKSDREDGRYHALRNWAGYWQHLVYFLVFVIQWALALLFSLPIWWLSHYQELNWNGYAVAALVVFAVALVGEIVADAQLHRFKRQQREKAAAKKRLVCRKGLWRYSRHPNYFFEWLHWFAYPIAIIGQPHYGWLWLAPLAMLLFLIFVTGIPYTEAQAIKSKGAAYKRYQQETSAFIPWRRKHVR